MKTFLMEFERLWRGGFWKISSKVIVITALFMFVFGRYIGIELEILIFILTPFALMLDYDANKYVISYSLPISMKHHLYMLFLITILDSFLAVGAICLSSLLVGDKIPLVVSCMMFFLNIIGSNVCYYLFCSQEFKKDVLDEDKKQLTYQGVIGALIGIGIVMRLKWGIESPLLILANRLAAGTQWVFIGILGSVMVLWTWLCIKRVEAVVRDKKM